MDRLQSMRVFAKVADSGSFASAADSLGLANSVVTRYVADLEHHLGARLLNRTTRSLSLTEAGSIYIERCHQILAEIDEASQIIGQATGTLRGPLRVNAPVSFGIRYLAPIAAKFAKENPDVRLDVTLVDRTVDIIEEGVDLAIRVARIPSSSLIARKLAPARMVVCASPAYLRANGMPKKPGDLVNHRCLEYTYSPTHDEWRFICPDKREVGVRINSALYSNNGDILRAAALEGVGIIMMPTFLVGSDFSAGRLVPLLLDYELPELGIYALFNSRQYVSAKLRAFIDFVAASVTKDPEWDAWSRPQQNDFADMTAAFA
eukprot:gene14086-14205_t